MDDSRLQEAHAAAPSDAEPTLFIPMKLVLQPNGLTVELRRPDMLLGRHSAADLRLPLPDVSRRHCRFLFQEGTWRIIDQESLNGIFLNEERVQEAALRDQDIVGIGGLRFQVLFGDVSQVDSSPCEHVTQTRAMLQNIAHALPEPYLADVPQRKAS